MTNRRSRPSLKDNLLSRNQHRERLRQRLRDAERRKLLLESLEDRRLMAVGPRLAGIQPTDGALLSTTQVDVRSIAPRDLKINFDESQIIDASTLSGIRVVASGGDRTFNDGNEVVIQPGFIGVNKAPQQNEVEVRFAETLTDDVYRVEIFSKDVAALGVTALRNSRGEAFIAPQANADRQVVDFELDLAPQVVAVVPQPVRRNVQGGLTQVRNTIEVYFNNDKLLVRNDDVGNPTFDSAENPDFYQLIFTNDSVRNTDDVVIKPISVDYDRAANSATLTFAQDLDQLIDPNNGSLIGPGTFRLRIGTNEAAPLPPLSILPVMEISSDFNTADAVIVQFTAVRSGESNISIVVTTRDLGAASRAPIVGVDQNRVFVELNSRSGFETRAVDLVQAINAHAVVRQHITAAVNAGDPTTLLGNRSVNYSPLSFSGLGSSYETATNLTDDTDVGPIVVVTGSGGTFVDGEFFKITDAANVTRTFEFDGDVPAVLNDRSAIGISFSERLTQSEMANLIRDAINGASFGVRGSLAGNTIRLEGEISVDLSAGVSGLKKLHQNMFNSGLTIAVTGGGETLSDGESFTVEDANGVNRQYEFDTGFTMSVAASGGAALADGQLLTISDGIRTVTFEFEDASVTPGVTGTNIPLPFAAADSQAVIVGRLITLIANEVALGNVTGLRPFGLGRGQIHLGGSANNTIDVANAPALTVSGQPGASSPGAIAVPIVPHASFRSDDVARAISAAVNLSGSVTASVSGSRIRLNGEQDVVIASGVRSLSVDIQGRFDTGPVLKVSTTAAGIGDGQSISIQDDRGVTRVFEFNRNGILNEPSAIGVNLTGAESAKQVAQILASAISSAGFRVRATAVSDIIYLTNDRDVDLDPALRAISATSQGVVISSAIGAGSFDLDLIGGNDDPGHRDIPEQVGDSAEQHINTKFGANGRDATPGATTIFYNFRPDYGQDPLGGTLLNAITPEQRQRAREAFELWGEYLGVQFLESEREGLTIATGDLRALSVSNANVLNYPSFNFRVLVDPEFANSLLILDSSVQWNDDFGNAWFRNTMVGIGSMLGLERANDLPRSTLMAFTSNFSFANAPTPEPIFPGNHDITHGQHLYRPDGTDIDLYRFTIDLESGKTGILSAETFAERQPNSSLLDTVISLYRENVDGTRELIARNDDYYGRDSFVEVNLAAGTYYIGVSATGNTKFDPTIDDSGFGGRSQGPYDLRMNFRSQVDDTDAIRDEDLQPTVLDGDSDGVPGGVYSFWFQTANLNRVLEIEGNGGTFRDGQIITLTSSQGVVRRFEFDNNNAIAAGNIRVAFGPTTTPAQMATTLANAILGTGIGVNAIASGNRITLDGDRIVSLSPGFSGIEVHGKTIFVDKNAGPNADGTLGRPFNNVARNGFTNAFAATHPGDIVRIVGNGGADGNLATLRDNIPYEFGFSTLAGQILTDGTEMAVPKGVTVMVEPGAIFKLRRSWMGVGSSSLLVDRSAGALQVLGTPQTNVYFTSWLDETLGRDTHPPTTQPTRGDWGGFIFRNDVDVEEARPNLEDQGIFLNYVNHAQILYGGSGGVLIDSEQQIVNPIQISQTRPTVSHNLIQFSADSAMSATPDSFDETNFHSPEFQSAGVFTSDYSRVGPEFTDNRLVDNSTNGLFIRIETPSGDSLQPLTVSGRFDDTDVVHVVAENLVIRGSESAPFLDLSRPQVNLITYSPRVGGALPAGTYNYKLTFVDRSGFESRPSTATPNVTIGGATGTIQLNQLPPSSGDFVKRRVYRTSDTAGGVYTLVAELDSSDTVYVDDGASLTATLQRDPPDVSSVQGVVRPRGTLPAGQYNYRIVFVDADGRESASSDATSTTSFQPLIGPPGSILLSGLPAATGNFVARRLYRSTIDGISPYTLVAELDASSSTYVDDGFTLGTKLSASSFGVVRARPSARLRIDPGTVVKLEGGRIEASFGAQLIAEGADGQEVVFTSRIDDTYGAGGTFDTNDDNAQTPAENQPQPGDWGGLYFGHLSSASLDNVVISYAGGINRLSGTFVGFNAVEIHQADVRITNTTIEKNDLGIGGQGPFDRFGRGYNRPAVIFARGAQPILVDNIIRDNFILGASAANSIAAITINANSLTHELLTDSGRETGLIELIDRYADNHGPLIRGNRFDNNGINGLVIRGEELTTQSIWDDTDVVHVLTNRYDRAPVAEIGFQTLAFDEIIIPEHHSYGGLRLQSSPSESLVVKLEGVGGVNNFANLNPTSGAGFTATGRRLGEIDRIGGTIEVVGQPGFPVVLTSIHDDTVGAGVRPDDKPQSDTNNNGIGSIPRPNDWRSVRLDQFSNDRNVEIVMELERGDETAPGVNATANTAQNLGTLAASESASDDNRRLGFEIQGFLNDPADIDVYSFRGTAGTEVWVDIDRTTFSLDTVVELLDANGTVLARSNDTLRELDEVDFVSPSFSANLVNPLQKSPAPYYPTHVSNLPKDFFSTNPRDAGMRISLPGVAGAENNYHFRVRSNNGLTSGIYQLQVRIRENDEFPGSTVRFADIRYANSGIEIVGLPKHSPFLGEAQEDEETGTQATNNTVVESPITPGNRPQNLGNLLASDRGAISVAGSLSAASDVDFYRMNVTYEAVTTTSVHHAGMVFDVDYADSLLRPDTTVSVFDATGRLVLIGRESDIAEDRPGPLAGADLADLSRGSVGLNDPYIGPVEMPQGEYFVAVTSNALIPSALNSPGVRVEPLNTVRRIAEDRIGSTLRQTAELPVVPRLFDPSFSGNGPNLWHVTSFGSGVPGHGIPPSFGQTGTFGGAPGSDIFSLRFGSRTGGTVGATDAGSVSSNTFSLEGYSAGDKPVLYFNYNHDATSVQRFRAVIVDGSGATRIVASNSNVGPSQLGAGGWQQARIPLDEFVGKSDLRLRFEFDANGVSGTNGAFVDDIIIGLAERGEMVAFAPVDTSFASNPGSPGQILSGDYQLEMRRASEFGSVGTRGFQLTDTIGTNDRLAEQTTIVAPNGNEVVEGQTVVISDGVNSVTFEYEDPEIGNGVSAGNVEIRFKSFSPAVGSFVFDPNYVIARRIRDAINSPQVQTTLKLRAGLSDGSITGTTSTDPRINLYGSAIVDIPEPFSVSQTTTSANTLRDTILGTGISPLGNASFTGSDTSAGVFVGGSDLLGMQSGILLTSGNAQAASEPNSNDLLTGRASLRRDADLDAAFGVTTTDSSTLEFQFQFGDGSGGGDLHLNFLFASEEYNENIGTPFSDVVAIFVDGANVALVPNTMDRVSIDTINSGTPFDPTGATGQNANLYNNNDPNDGGRFLQRIGYDGFTDRLTASALGLGPGPHTIKIAVSDVGDTTGDSAIFIESGSMGIAPLVRPPQGINVIRYTGYGDQNHFRDQGQTLIHSNSISNTLTYGVAATTALRDSDETPVSPFNNAVRYLNPSPGPVRNLSTADNVPGAGGFTPGIVISNNTISDFGVIGVHVGGHSRTIELTPGFDVSTTATAGDVFCDGDQFIVTAFGNSVLFEFEDIGGGPTNACGSGVGGGNGWSLGATPVFYRQTGANYTIRYVGQGQLREGGPRSTGYTQDEMAHAIHDAIESSILVQNGTRHVIETNVGESRLLGQGPFLTTPGLAVALERVSSVVTVPGFRSSINIRPISVAVAPQPFARIVNNTIYGSDGDASRFPESNAEPNDTIFNAVDTRQGRAANPDAYTASGRIGDGQNFRIDSSVDVDVYQFQLDVGDRVRIDVDTQGLDSLLRLINSVGEEVAFSDNNLAPGEPASSPVRESYIDFTALSAGTYFAAISGAGNRNYSPISLASRTAPASQGPYQISVNVDHPREAVISVNDPSAFADGQTFRIYQIPDLVNQSVNFATFEFDTNGAVVQGNIPITLPASGVGNRHPELAVSIVNAINNSPLLNIQNLPNAPFGNANPLNRVTAEAYGGVNRGVRIAEQFNGLDHLESGITASYERFVLIRNLAYIEDVNSGITFVPNPAASTFNQDSLLTTRERGILVSEQATPTLLNNIVANSRFGIEQAQFQAGSPGPADSPPGILGVMVEGGSLFQHNAVGNSNIPRGGSDFQITLGNSDPLFVNAANGDFYPAPNSQAIDSAVDSVEERAAFRSIKASAGISLSPILSPDRDQSGQLRKDDPVVFTPSGIGANVFKDRGSLDRADFVGPSASLINPLDNDVNQNDLDSAVSVVQLSSGVFTHFSIQLVDGFEAADPFPGVGLDDTTVDGRTVTVEEDGISLGLRGPAVSIFEDGRFLREGIDYTFRFDTTSNTIRLSPLAGIWPNDKVYVIGVNNRDRFVIDAPDGRTPSDGSTFTITNADGDTATYEYDSGFIVKVSPTLAIQVPSQGAAAGGISDGQRFSIDTGKTSVVFEFDRNGNVLPGSRPVLFSSSDSAEQIAASIVTAIQQAVVAGALSGLAPKTVAGGIVHVGANAQTLVNVSGSSLVRNILQFPTGLTVPAGGGAAISEGEVFRLRNGATNVAFEFDMDGGVAFGNRPIPFTSTDTVDQIVNSIVAAISTAQAAGAQLALSPVNGGNGLVILGAGPNHIVDVSQTVLQRTVFVGGVSDGESFFVRDGLNPLVRFEFDSNGKFVDVDGNNLPDNQLVPFSNADTHEDIAVRLANTIANVNVNLTPSHYGAGNIHVGGTVTHVVDINNSPGLTLLGRPGVRPSTTLQIPRSLGLRVPANANNLITDGMTFSLTDGTRTVVFEFDSDGVTVPGNRPVVFTSISTIDAIAAGIAAEITSANIGLSATNLGNGLVNLNSAPNYSLDLSGTVLLSEGFVSGLNDGDRFSIDAGNVVVTFEFEDSSQNNGVTGGSVGILFQNGDFVDTVANGMAAAIRSAGLNLPNATNLGNGAVRLFDSTRHITRVIRGNIELSGVPGASVAINFEPGMSDDLVARAIVDAINRGQLTGVTSSIRGGSTLFVNVSDAQGAPADFVNSRASVTGISAFFLSAVQDIPGNTLKANQITNETQFVILMPGVELDFGDAADPFAGPGRYPTLFDNNGARHVITDARLRLGSRVDADPDGQPTTAGDGDDADHILQLAGTPLTARALAPFTIQVPAAGGALFADGDTFQLTRAGFAPLTFEFDNNNVVAGSNIAIPFSTNDTADSLAVSIATVVANSNAALQAVSLGGGAVFLGGKSIHQIDTSRSTLTTEGLPPNRLLIPAGGSAAVFDNQSVEFFDGINRLTLEFDANGSGSTIPGSVVVPVGPATTSAQIAAAIIGRVAASTLNIQLSSLGADGQGNEVVHITGAPSHVVDLAGSALTFTGRTPTALIIPGAGLAATVPTRLQLRVPNTGGSGINDGDRFIISDGLNPPVTFEFDRGGGVQTGTRRVVFGLSHTPDTVASSIVAAIQDAIASGLLINTTPTNLGGGLVDLGGTIFHSLDTTISTLTQIGPVADGNRFIVNDGVHPAITFEFDVVGSGAVGPGNQPVRIRLSDSTDGIANAIVTAIKDRVSANLLQGIDPENVGSGIVDMRAVAGVQVNFAGTPGVLLAGTTGGISDGHLFTINDGNKVFAFEFDRNGKSTLGNIVVPFGSLDTPNVISATLASVIRGAGVQLSASNVGTGIVRLEGPDDDGISFDGILSPGKTSPITVTASAVGILNAWMDFNQDGDWDDPNENILNNVRLDEGQNRLSITIPDLSPPPSSLPLGNTFARFRLSSTGNLLPTGLAIDGEVEDYRVRILSNDSPTIVPPGIPDQIVIEDAGDTVVPLTAAFDDPDLHNGNGDILAFTIVANDNPALVAVRVSPDGKSLVLDYRDNANGTANIRIRATDQGGVFVEQPFLVHVLPVNDVPVAIGETLLSPEDQPLNVSLQADDGDPEVVQSLLFAIDIGPANGTLTDFNPTTGTVRYTPNNNFNGVDTIVFSVVDDGSAGGAPRNSQRGTLTISVQSVNDIPIANAQAVTGTEDTNRSITLTGADGDPDATQSLTFAIATNPLQGTIVSIDPATGAVVYRPNSNFVGIDTFTFRVTDDGLAGAPAGLSSLPGTVTITVTAVNDPPIANNLTANVTEDTATPITLDGNDGDPEVVQGLTYAIVSQPTRGTLTGLNPGTGVVTYTPQNGFNGTDSFTYRIVSDDGTAGNPPNLSSGVATVTITVSPVNDPPVGTGQTINVNEDGQIPFSLTGDDGDPELNQLLTFALATQPANGTLFGFNPANGQLTYRPNANFNGVDTFTFTVRDNGNPNLTSAPATVTISVTAVNDPPVANANILAINEDAPTTFTLTASDGDPERNQSLTFVLATQPSRGVLSAFNPATGQVTYTPNPDFNGVDSFSFTVSDDTTAGGPAISSAAAVISINIAPLNDAPQFTRGSNPSVNEDSGPQTILGWASAVRAGPASAADETSQVVSFIVSNDNNGLFATQPSVASNGTLTFNPAENKNGVAIVTVQAIDNGPSNSPNVNQSATQTFTISVNSVNDAPEFLRGPNRTLNEDSGPQSIPNWATNISPGPASATDEVSQTVSFVVSSNNPGMFSVQPAVSNDGTLTFTPAPNGNGTALVTVRAQDSGASNLPNVGTSIAQTFTIAINAINDAPEFVAGSNPVVNEDAGVVVINSWATGIRPGPESAADENSQQLQFLINLISTSGTLAFLSPPVVDPATGNLTFRSANETHGTATFTFALRDNGFSIPPHSNSSAQQTVVITVNSLNDAPQFVRGADQVVNEDTGAQSIAGWATDIRPGPAAAVDELGQTVSFSTTNDNNALFASQPAVSNTGTLTYTPASDANGTAVVVVTAVDSGSGVAPNRNSSSQTVTIRVTAVNDAPQFSRGPNISVAEDVGAHSVANWATNVRPGPLTAADESSQQLTFNISVVSTNGPISFTANPAINPATGNLTFTPAPNANGTAVIRVSLSDNGSGGPPNVNTSPAQSFTINVNPVNDPPFVANPINDFTVAEDSSNTVIELFPQVFDDFDILTNNDALTFAVVSNSNTSLISENLNGTRLALAYQPNQSGTARIVVQARDRNGASVNNTFNVTVTPSNDPPIVNNDVAVTARNQPITIDILANDSDTDGTINPASVLIVAAPSRGTATVNANGRVSYTPPNNFIGETSFRYTVQDNTGASSSEATVTIKVNESPVARDDTATTRQGVASTINVLSNDTDSDGQLDVTSVTITTLPTKGTASVNPLTGVVTYTPALSQFGADSFRYRVRDNNGVLSNEATVSLTIEKTFSWQNPGTRVNDRLDVNNDDQITPLDALIVINYLNNNGPGELPTPSPTFSPPPFLDTNGDGFATAQDALLIINFLNSGEGGEGESPDNATDHGGFESFSVLSLPEHQLLQQPLVREVLPELTRQFGRRDQGTSRPSLVESSKGNYGNGLNQSHLMAFSDRDSGDEWEGLLQDLAESESDSLSLEDAVDSVVRDLFG